MKFASERAAGCDAVIPADLDRLVSRLDRLAAAPSFAAQRDIALRQSLEAYVAPAGGALLSPLPEEVALADLVLYADFYPTDGQLTLIEQLRDVITEHIPDEERAWLDPLKHSYLDLVEWMPAEPGAARRGVRSLGNGRIYEVPADSLARALPVGTVLLARLVREPGDPESRAAQFAGPALVLSKEDARILYDATADERREMEIVGGSFELGDWPEFAKRFGYLLLRQFARMAMGALLEAVREIRWRTADDAPYYYVVALYEHHAGAFLSTGLGEWDDWTPEPMPVAADAVGNQQRGRWGYRVNEGGTALVTVARLTLTTTQLFVECDSRERLDTVKHRLAAAFGFSLHFRGESVQPPPRQITSQDLASDEPLTVVVTADEERRLLNTFLETTYLEWADRDCPALGNQTPRHAAAKPADRAAVAAVIDQMERNDLGRLRSGVPAFDYDTLRAHVGLR